MTIKYLLAEDQSLIPDSLKDHSFIKTPVNRVMVFSTTHIGFIDGLGEAEGISGVSGLQYVCNSIVRSGSTEGRVFDIGYPPNVNYERILSLEPDIVFLYGLESSVTGIKSRLQSSGIPVILIAEYLEAHPLGKMEWIKVFGALYGKEDLSVRIFNESVEEYEKWTKITGSLHNHPGVMVGLPWKDTWYMAGGASFTSNLIRDAGGDYLWEENSSAEYIPLSLEAVISRSIQADIWINAGSAKSIAEIFNRDPRFKNLAIFETGEIYNNDAKYCENGGNPFWEKGVIEPHIILKDMIKIFHPEIMQSHDFVYYRKLE